MTNEGLTRPAPMSHREAWETIPWLVNGTLAPEEETTLLAHLETCPACMAELAQQRALSEMVASMGAVRPAMASTSRAPAEPRSVRSPMDRVRDWLSGVSSAGLVAGAGTLAVAALVLTFGLPTEDGYTTLTDEPASPTAEVDTIELRIRPAPDADPDAVRATLEAAGVTDITAPSGTGLIRARIGVAAREATIAALTADPLFLVVAGD